MTKPKICPVCNKGHYDHGDGIYDFYTCGHAYEKPLNSSDKGRFISYKSPYQQKIKFIIQGSTLTPVGERENPSDMINRLYKKRAGQAGEKKC